MFSRTRSRMTLVPVRNGCRMTNPVCKKYCRTNKIVFIQYHWSTDIEYLDMRHKTRKTELRLSPGGGRRRWDKLPTDLLVQIFRRLPFFFLLDMSCVCRSWRSSVLDTIFPSTEVLPLHELDTLPIYLHSMYLRFIQSVLDARPITQWCELTFSTKITLKEHAIRYIAERSPCLESLEVQFRDGWKQLEYCKAAFPYWKNLESFSCRFVGKELISVACELRTHCKKISSLALHGGIGIEEASIIVEKLPGVENLSLRMSSISRKALLILDDGLRKLVMLNMEHALCLGERFLGGIEAIAAARAKVWNEIREKVSGNKIYMRCEEIMCLKCQWMYLSVAQRLTISYEQWVEESSVRV